MYGLQAINAANGWAVTIAGISIVFTGLLVLAAAMANLQKVLNLWDRKGDLLQFLKAKPEAQPVQQPPVSKEPGEPAAAKPTGMALTSQQVETANAFQLIINRLGEPFSLFQLLEKASLHGISHPHHHLDTFLKLHLIVEAEGDQVGLYKWRNDVQIVSAEGEA